MQKNNKFIIIFINILKQFLINFCITLFIVFTLILFFKIKNNILNQTLILYLMITLGYFTFFFWYINLKQKNIFKIFIDELLLFLFLINLLLILLKINFFINIYYFPILSLITFFIGFTLIFKNNNEISYEINDEYEKEKKLENKKYNEFNNIFLKINKIPIINYIFRFIYKEGYLYIIFLLLILTLFFLIKIPYMDLSFTGPHRMKYSSYVEPAKHMIEKGLLWNQTKYQADPILLPDGKYDSFGSYPFMEWGIVFTNYLFPNNSLEYNTRIFMAFLGIILLLLIYRFLKEFLIKKHALIIIYLLSINTIFQFFTYVTVLDPINLIFLFLSLIYLITGLKKNELKKLFLAGIFAGIGISVKYHAVIFYFPIFIIFIFLYNKISNIKKISYFIIIIPNFILQTIFFRISFRFLPKNFLLYILLFVSLILIELYIYKNINFIYNYILKLINGRVKLIYIIILLIIAEIFYLIFKIDWIQNLFNDFITDKYLIFNLQMYNTLLNNIINWLSPILYYISISMIFLLILIRNNKIKLLIFSFFTSSLIYFILTSKVLYFHEYYFHIIIFFFVLLFSFFYYLIKLYKSKFTKIFFLIILILIIATISNLNIKQARARISIENPDIKIASEYLLNNLDENQFFIFNTEIPATISYYSNRYSLVEELNTNYNKEFIKIIKKDLENNINFGQIMKNYNIKYYVSNKNPESKNNDFSYLFEKEEKDKIISERTILILCKENKLCQDNRLLPEINYENFEKNIKPFIKLVYNINNIYIYQFQ